jgi:hypothetical protein
MTDLRGGYRILKDAFIRKKAQTKSDPTHIFYEAMLRHKTYEAYLADVGRTIIDRPGYKRGPTNGRDEILYCRRNDRIADA